jgi:phosphonate transport system substrate-binding protein
VQGNVDRRPTDLAQLRPDCSPEIAAVVARGLRARADRFATALAFRQALDEASPRQIDDRENHAAYVAELFEDAGFVEAHGELPTAASTSTVNPRAFAEPEAVTVALRRSRRTMTFGLSPAHGPKLARSRGDVLVDQLQRRLGCHVRSVVFADYETLVDCVIQGEVDFAWMPPATFIDAADRGATLGVVAQRLGAPTYDAAIFVRAESACADLDDLRGRSIAWVDRHSCSGYVFAAAAIRDRLGPLGGVFSAQHFHGSHRAVCDAVLNGWADAGATFVNRDANGQVEEFGFAKMVPERAAELRAIAFFGPIPGDNVAYRPELPDDVRAQLTDALTALGDDDGGRRVLADVFGAEALVTADVSLYAPTREMLRRLAGE